MQGQENSQLKSILDKIVEKYKTVQTSSLKHWIGKYSGFSVEESNIVVAKFQSFIGFDEKKQLVEEEIKTFILLCVALQKGHNLVDLKQSQLVKYKQHSFKFQKKTSKVKESHTEQTPNEKLSVKSNSIKQSIEIEIPKKQEVKTLFQAKQETITPIIPKQPVKTEITSQSLSMIRQQSEKLIDSNSFKKKRTNLDVSRSPISRHEYLKVSVPSPQLQQISPSKPKQQNQLEESISTKMEIDNLVQNQQLVTPTFPMKSLEKISNIFESQIQISNRLKGQSKHIQVQINKFQKVSQGWSTVVKYQILTLNQEQVAILRRYSEFSKLHSYLSEKYKGVIIPQLPPKEYLKGAIWSADNSFLNERRVGLELFLNKVLAHQTLGEDELILSFISDQKLDQSSYGQETYFQTADKYFKTLVSVAKNTSQIKDYGLAYYSYMKSSVREQLPPQINNLYDEIKSHLEKFNKFKQYIQKIDILYTVRGQVETQELNIPERKKADNIFKKQVNQIYVQFSQAKTAYDVFCKLKAEAKWYQLLYETKKDKAQLSKQDEEVKIRLDESEAKLKKTGPMLQNEMQSFLKIKHSQWKLLLSNFVIWKTLKNE